MACVNLELLYGTDVKTATGEYVRLTSVLDERVLRVKSHSSCSDLWVSLCACWWSGAG